MKCHLKLHIDNTLHYIQLTLTVASLTRFSAFLLAGLSSVLVAFQLGGSVAEWLAGWTQAQKGPGSNRSRDAVG